MNPPGRPQALADVVRIFGSSPGMHGIVTQNVGTVEVASHTGPGTTFRVTLPAHAGPPVQPSAPVVAPARGGRETILLAEDQEPVRVLARLILEQHGYRVHAATDGADGLSVAEGLPAVDLLLTDVVMPRLTGPQLAAQLTAQRPGLPVLFMSGYTGETSSSGMVVPPGAPLLRKPFTPTALLEAVRHLLDGAAPTPAGA